MKIDGILKVNPNTGRAELVAQGETFSFPGRMAQQHVVITIPDAQQARMADPLAVAGASPQALRGTLRMQNGRAELAVASGETLSFPARYGGRLIAVDVVDLAQEAARQLQNQPRQPTLAQALQPAGSTVDFRDSRDFGDRALLPQRFVDEDLDVLGTP